MNDWSTLRLRRHIITIHNYLPLFRSSFSSSNNNQNNSDSQFEHRVIANINPFQSSSNMAIRLVDLHWFIVVTAICIGLSQLLAYGASSKGNHNALSKVAFLATAVQWIFYIIHGSGLILGNQPTEMLYDLSGAVTFTICTIYSIFLAGGIHKLSFRQKLLNSAVLIWCFRLGSFLFTRILGEGGRDSRFDKLRIHFFRFWNMWTIQGLWVFLTAFAVFVSNDSVTVQKPLGTVDFIGIVLWVIGFLFEIIADEQKKTFRHDVKNKGTFIQTGLWSISRHPNYFGEILVWFGVFVLSISGYDRPQQWLSFISPSFVAFLLIKISGIPLLEKAANEKWSDNAAYIAYKKNVPVLIPFLGRKGDASF